MRISNSELKYLRSLGQKKVRQREKKFLLEGWRALREALNAAAAFDLVAVTPRYLEDPDYKGFIDELTSRKVTLREISDKDLGGVAESVHAQGLIAAVVAPSWDMEKVYAREPCTIVAADSVSDPGNLGSLIRSADWFGIDAVVLSKGSVDLSNDKVIRSTVGSVFHVPVLEGVDLVPYLQARGQQGFSVYALSADGTVPFTEAQFSDRSVLVVGSEARGVTRDVRSLTDSTITIPRYGRGDSLNVGVAAAIVLARVAHQRSQNAASGAATSSARRSKSK